MSVIFENELTKARIRSAELVGFSPFDAQCLAESVLKGESVAALPGDFVLVVEGGHGEVVVDRVRLETFEGIDGRLGPLPDIADHVIEIAMGKTVHRAG